jgi:hypothetical protein
MRASRFLQRELAASWLALICCAPGLAENICRPLPVDSGTQPDRTAYFAALNSPEWKNYHLQVAEALKSKIEPMAQALVGQTPTPNNLVSYNVDSDGKIKEIKVVQPSCSPLFDSICVAAIASMSGKSIMRLPKIAHTPTLCPTFAGTFTGKTSEQHQELSEREIRIMMKLPVDRMRTMLDWKPSELHKKLARM